MISKTKVWLTLLIVVILFSPSTMAGFAEQLEHPTDFKSLIELFDSLNYTWYGVEEEERMEISISIFLEGQEEVDGEKADRVRFLFEQQEQEEESQEFNIWFDEEGGLLQVVVDGEQIPVQFAGMMLSSFQQSLFMPFQMMEGYNPEIILEGIEVPGWTVEDTQKTVEEIGEQEIEALRINALVEPPAFEDEMLLEATIGDFGLFQLLVSLEVREAVSPDQSVFGYQLKGFNLR